MTVETYSIGIGDRFGREGVPQLAAFQKAQAAGVDVTPVWNKSNREHTLIGATPEDTRRASGAAVRAAGWTRPWHLKTAGTNWLEEVVGLALAGGDCLSIAKESYAVAHGRIEELSQPYE